MKMGQKAVIVSFSTAEAMPLGGEGHARNDGKVNVGIVVEKGTEGFLYAKGSADSESLLPLIAMQFQFFSYNRGQEYILSLGMKMADEVMGADFIGQGVIEEDGV